MFTDVSTYRELHPGFEQTSFMNGRDRVLLHKVAKNVPLKRHRHTHAQFGYNFWGEYEFVVDDVAFNVQQGSRYLLNGLTHHAAYATTDYYSMDYKFIASGDLSNRASFDPVGERFDVCGGKGVDIEMESFHFELTNDRASRVVRILPIGTVPVRLQMDAGKINLAVTSRACEFIANNRPMVLEAMRIYKFDPVDELNIQFGDSKSEILVLSI